MRRIWFRAVETADNFAHRVTFLRFGRGRAALCNYYDHLLTRD